VVAGARFGAGGLLATGAVIGVATPSRMARVASNLLVVASRGRANIRVHDACNHQRINARMVRCSVR
jgi:hypothetical protein